MEMVMGFRLGLSPGWGDGPLGVSTSGKPLGCGGGVESGVVADGAKYHEGRCEGRPKDARAYAGEGAGTALPHSAERLA